MSQLPTLIPHKKTEAQLWITNISRQKDIQLGDLRLTVRRGKSYNLLDKKHFHYTEEQIRASIASGSIFKKRDVIRVREVAPVVYNMRVDIYNGPRDGIRPVRQQPPPEHKQFAELDFDEVSDDSPQAQEQYAAETAELDLMDKMPALPVDPKYRKMDSE
jgi:hypothetical protein